jgi:hypothetical protein
MREPTLTSFCEERRYEIRFQVEGVDVIHAVAYGRQRPLAMLPTVLEVWYRLGGEWDPEGEKGWRASWILYGRRVLKSGAVSDKQAVSMQQHDFPDRQTPAWIADVVEQHHPEREGTR